MYPLPPHLYILALVPIEYCSGAHLFWKAIFFERWDSPWSLASPSIGASDKNYPNSYTDRLLWAKQKKTNSAKSRWWWLDLSVRSDPHKMLSYCFGFLYGGALAFLAWIGTVWWQTTQVWLFLSVLIYPSGDLWSRLERGLIRFKTRIQQFLHDTKRYIYSFLPLKRKLNGKRIEENKTIEIFWSFIIKILMTWKKLLAII